MAISRTASTSQSWFRLSPRIHCLASLVLKVTAVAAIFIAAVVQTLAVAATAATIVTFTYWMNKPPQPSSKKQPPLPPAPAVPPLALLNRARIPVLPFGPQFPLQNKTTPPELPANNIPAPPPIPSAPPIPQAPPITAAPRWLAAPRQKKEEVMLQSATARKLPPLSFIDELHRRTLKRQAALLPSAAPAAQPTPSLPLVPPAVVPPPSAIPSAPVPAASAPIPAPPPLPPEATQSAPAGSAAAPPIPTAPPLPESSAAVAAAIPEPPPIPPSPPSSPQSAPPIPMAPPLLAQTPSVLVQALANRRGSMVAGEGTPDDGRQAPAVNLARYFGVLSAKPKPRPSGEEKEAPPIDREALAQQPLHRLGGGNKRLSAVFRERKAGLRRAKSESPPKRSPAKTPTSRIKPAKPQKSSDGWSSSAEKTPAPAQSRGDLEGLKQNLFQRLFSRQP